MFLPFTANESTHPQFDELQEILFFRAALINSHMFMDLSGMGEVERIAAIAELTQRLHEISH